MATCNLIYFPKSSKRAIPRKAKPTDKEKRDAPLGRASDTPLSSDTKGVISHVSYAHTAACLPKQSLTASKEPKKGTLTAMDWIRAGCPFPPLPEPTPEPEPPKKPEKGGAR